MLQPRNAASLTARERCYSHGRDETRLNERDNGKSTIFMMTGSKIPVCIADDGDNGGGGDDGDGDVDGNTSGDDEMIMKLSPTLMTIRVQIESR